MIPPGTGDGGPFVNKIGDAIKMILNGSAEGSDDAAR